MPLHEQVQKLREEIHKLKEENLRFQLAEVSYLPGLSSLFSNSVMLIKVTLPLRARGMQFMTFGEGPVLGLNYFIS